MTDIIDEERDELLGELIGTVVIRAVRHDRWHAVGVVESANEMVGGRFRCRIRRVGVVFRCFIEEVLSVRQMVLGGGSLGGERRLDALGVGHLQSAIDLVRRDVVETLALVLLRQGLPVEFRRLKHG